MNESQLIKTHEGIEIQLIESASKAWVRKVLLIFISGLLIMPILIVYSLDDPLIEAIFIPFIIFWGVAIYLLRLYLWNSIGKEVYVIGNGKFYRYFGYKYFKDGRRILEYESIKAKALTSADESKKDYEVLDKSEDRFLGYIEFNIDEEVVISQIKLDDADLIKLVDQINKYV